MQQFQPTKQETQEELADRSAAHTSYPQLNPKAILEHILYLHKVDKADAETYLLSLPPDILMATVELGRKKARSAYWNIIALVTFILLLILFAQLVLKNGRYGIYSCITITSGVFACAHIVRTRNLAVKTLASIDSKQAVGKLIEALTIRNTKVKEAIHKSLARLLPQCSVAEVSRITSEQRRLLRQLVNSIDNSKRNKPSLVNASISILKVWEQIGEKEELEIVENLARREWHGANIGVYNAAVECLPYLKIRVEQLEESRTLLRGSSPSVDGADVLLRPAMGCEQTPSDELLRPNIVAELGIGSK